MGLNFMGFYIFFLAMGGLAMATLYAPLARLLHPAEPAVEWSSREVFVVCVVLSLMPVSGYLAVSPAADFGILQLAAALSFLVLAVTWFATKFNARKAAVVAAVGAAWVPIFAIFPRVDRYEANWFEFSLGQFVIALSAHISWEMYRRSKTGNATAERGIDVFGLGAMTACCMALLFLPLSLGFDVWHWCVYLTVAAIFFRQAYLFKNTEAAVAIAIGPVFTAMGLLFWSEPNFSVCSFFVLYFFASQQDRWVNAMMNTHFRLISASLHWVCRILGTSPRNFFGRQTPAETLHLDYSHLGIGV
jgi:hypothetical protein